MLRSTAIWIFAAVAFLAASLLPRDASAEPAVVVSIKPIHSLVAAVMEGVEEPYLLVRGGGSPHNFSLTPSDARALEGADIVFWVGANLERFLEESLETLSGSAEVVTLAASENIHLLNYRDEKGAQAVHNGEVMPENPHQYDAGDYDPHLWLDPQNARVVVKLTAALLSKQDPANALRYESNARRTVAGLNALEQSMRSRLVPVQNEGYLVFHDGFQYLQQAFDLNEVGSVTLSPDRQPGARRVLEVRERLRQSDARCIFVEPQFEPGIVSVIIEDLDVRVAEIDPLGADLQDGPELYFKLMERNAIALADCLGAGSQ